MKNKWMEGTGSKKGWRLNEWKEPDLRKDEE